MAAADLQPVRDRALKGLLAGCACERLVDIEEETRIGPRRLEGRQMDDIAPQEELFAAAFYHVAAMTGRMTRQRHHRDARSHFTAGDRARPAGHREQRPFAHVPSPAAGILCRAS